MSDVKQPYSKGYLGRVIVDKESFSAKLEWFNGKGYKISECSSKACKAECCYYVVTLNSEECENLKSKVEIDKVFGKYCIRKESENNPCPILSKRNKCKDYSNRPIICKVYPFGIDPVEDENNVVYWIDKPDKCGAKIDQEESSSLDNDLIRLAINETKDEIRRREIVMF